MRKIGAELPVHVHDLLADSEDKPQIKGIAGNLFFKQTITGRLPLSHLIGLGLLALVLDPVVTPLIFSLASAVALIVVAAWETRSPRDHAEA